MIDNTGEIRILGDEVLVEQILVIGSVRCAVELYLFFLIVPLSEITPRAAFRGRNETRDLRERLGELAK